MLAACTCSLSFASCRSSTQPSTTNIPMTGLQAYYPLNSNVNDESGNGHDASVNGDITWVKDRFGRPNRACHFNGANASVFIADSSGNLNFNTTTQSYSISCWVKLDSLIASRDMEIIMDRGTQAVQPTSYDIFYRGTLGRFVADAWDGVTNIIVPSQTKPIAGQWYHLVMVADQRKISLYVNGVRELSEDGASYPDSIPSFFANTNNGEKIRTIGDFYPTSVNGHHYFDGAIDDIIIYNRALSEDEIQNLYHE
jgi:Concanavalin A-like lectin/glucanases superfamily